MVKLGVILLVKLDGAEEASAKKMTTGTFALYARMLVKLIPELVVHRKYGNNAILSEATQKSIWLLTCRTKPFRILSIR
jgi:hypothetical protein